MEERRLRIWEAQREGLRNRLRDGWRLGEVRADALLAEWDEEAARQELGKLAPGYWTQAEAWLVARTGPREKGTPA